MTDCGVHGHMTNDKGLYSLGIPCQTYIYLFFPLPSGCTDFFRANPALFILCGLLFHWHI